MTLLSGFDGVFAGGIITGFPFAQCLSLGFMCAVISRSRYLALRFRAVLIVVRRDLQPLLLCLSIDGSELPIAVPPNYR